MDFGCEFDDSLFEDKKRKEDKIPEVHYNAKICTSQWYESADVETSSDENKMQVFKYRADWYYHQGKYTEAVNNYRLATDLLSSSNRLMRREMLESQARAHLKNGQITQARHTAHTLHCDSSTFDMLTVSLDLMAAVEEQDQQYAAAALWLKRLLLLHPASARTWLKLADVIHSLLSTHTSDVTHNHHTHHSVTDIETSLETLTVNDVTHISNIGSLGDKNSCDRNKSCDEITNHSADDATTPDIMAADNLPAVLLTCLCMSRLLMTTSVQYLSSHSQTRQRTDIEKITERIEEMNMSDAVVQTCSDFLRELALADQSDRQREASPEENAKQPDSDICQRFQDNWLSWTRRCELEINSNK